ncbi:PAS domain-containing sensor histidine kinase [Sphingomonas hengshuiensis]|uniref:PAS domain-containing sensor histidine kinase n=1 Tax=Sphingomonas hengshuiensis TaxID=1609977 RepID=UPI00069823DF|nr:ATP-binding protein [Sphingomonas hengshuiensis]
MTTAGHDADLFDMAHDSIVICDAAGRIVAWNAASALLYGWQGTEAIGRVADEMLRTQGPEDTARRRRSLLESGRWEGQLRRAAADDRPLVVEVRQRVRRDAGGAPVAIVETAREVTDRLKLAESERKYRLSFNEMPIALWELDAKRFGEMYFGLHERGIADFRAHAAAHPEFLAEALATLRVPAANGQALRLFGVRDLAALLAHMPALWADDATLLDAFAAHIAGAPTYSAETRIHTLSGEVRHVLFSVSFADQSRPESLNMVGAIDITERVRAEEALERIREDFTHAARIAMLGELTASIAHEVNQPLAAISAGAEASLRWLAAAQPDLDEVRALATRIVSDARRAADIIDRVRAMAQRRVGQREPIGINRIVEDVLLILRPELRARGVAVELDLAPADPPIEADRTQMQQVLVNLALNAAQAMDACPQPLLTLRTAREGDRALLRVEDNGPGIDEAAMPRLFDSFFTTRAAGLGMGLRICRSIVEAHGGHIRAGNLPGGGACFEIALPIAG